MLSITELDAWAENIAQIERHADQLSKLGKALERRGPEGLVTLHRIESEADAGRYLTQRTGAFLKTSFRSPPADKLTRLRLDKLARQFEVAGSKFENVSRIVLDKHKNLSMKTDSETSIRPQQQQQRQQHPEQQVLSQPLLEDNQLAFALANVAQRSEELVKLESDLNDLHTLFKDVATLAQMQQESLDTIETAVMEAGVGVAAGVSELVKAKKYQTQARKRMCCLIVTGTVTVAILVYWIISSAN